jgi:hypothetical protein
VSWLEWRFLVSTTDAFDDAVGDDTLAPIVDVYAATRAQAVVTLRIVAELVARRYL